MALMSAAAGFMSFRNSGIVCESDVALMEELSNIREDSPAESVRTYIRLISR